VRGAAAQQFGHQGGAAVDEGEEDAGGAGGATAALFPVEKGRPGHADAAGEGALGEAGAGADRCDVDVFGHPDVVDRRALDLSAAEGEGLLESTDKAVMGGHVSLRRMP
jgi:hypothetical protein